MGLPEHLLAQAAAAVTSMKPKPVPLEIYLGSGDEDPAISRNAIKVSGAIKLLTGEQAATTLADALHAGECTPYAGASENQNAWLDRGNSALTTFKKDAATHLDQIVSDTSPEGKTRRESLLQAASDANDFNKSPSAPETLAALFHANDDAAKNHTPKPDYSHALANLADTMYVASRKAYQAAFPTRDITAEEKAGCAVPQKAAHTR